MEEVVMHMECYIDGKKKNAEKKSKDTKEPHMETMTLHNKLA